MPKSKTSPTGASPARPATATGTAKGNRADPRAMSTRDRLVLVAIGGLVVAVLGFLALRGGDAAEGGGTAGAELEHVHGLGVDPASNALYAGTHYGLFRLPEQGDGTRVADRVQDFMGFTVAGPDHFLASGHPGEGQGGPSSLGLIESTNGGQTWQSLSLEGQADFHALEARHGRVYGYNSLTGNFMVSEDKKKWDSRSSVPMADFSVSPEDPDAVLATTEQGLVRSDDGGRTFGLVRGAPLLLLVSWADDGTIVGVGPEGTVHVSADDGATWERRGDLDGAPEALAAGGEREIYAAAGGAVLVSTDGGRQFTVRYRD